MRPRKGWNRLPRVPSADGIRQELEDHVARLTAQLMQEGHSREEAEKTARARFGDISKIERSCRRESSRGGISPASLAGVIRQAIRSLARSPSYSVALVLLIACGSAAAIASAVLVKRYLLDPLPYPGSERLFRIQRAAPGTLGVPGAPAVPQGLNSIEWPSADSLIEHNVAWEFDDFSLLGSELPERIYGIWTTPGYFGAYGVSPVIGRQISAEDIAARNNVAVLGYDLWIRKYRADSTVLGRAIRLRATDREQTATVFTIIGVLPQDFQSLNGHPDVVLPLFGNRRPSLILAREGVGVAALSDHLTAHAKALLPVDPDWRMHVEPARDSHVAPVRGTLRMLAAAAGLLLLVVIGNSAILVLGRSLARSRESGIRRALGAGTAQEYLTQFVEAALPTALGAIIGATAVALLYTAAGSSLAGYLGVELPSTGLDRGLSGGMITAIAAAAILISAVMGAVPWLAGLVADARAAMGGRESLGNESPRAAALRSGLIAVQVGMSLALMIATIQMWQATSRMQQRELGFDPNGVTLAYSSLGRQAYAEPDRVLSFYLSLQESVAGLPNVKAVGLIDAYPFQVTRGSQVRSDADEDDSGIRVVRQLITREYFDAMKLEFIRGEPFEPNRTDEIVISSSLAEKLWPGQDPVGRRMKVGTWQEIPESEPWLVVSGVVPDVAKTLAGEDWPDVYLPFVASPRSDMYLVVRSDPPGQPVIRDLQRVVARLDPQLPLAEIQEMDQVVAEQLSRPRFLTSSLVMASLLAVAVTSAGLLAVLGYLVRRGRKEIALRMAVGASGYRVVRWVAGKAALPLGLGLLLGHPTGIWLAGRVSEAASTAGATSHLAALALAIVAAGLAMAIPAAKAVQTDPNSALKSE